MIKLEGGGVREGEFPNRVLTVSKGCVTVTAPQAATPPERKPPTFVDI